MSCCAGKSQQANSTIPFRYGRLNYNHFQTGGITTESWSLSVWVQDAWEPHLIYILTIVLHKMAAQKADSATVVLNSIATTDFLLDYSLSEWMISISSYTLFTRMVCSKVNQRVLKRRISSMDTAHPRGVASHPIHPPWISPCDCVSNIGELLCILCMFPIHVHVIYYLHWHWTLAASHC